MTALARYFQRQNVQTSMLPLSIADQGGTQIGNALQSLSSDLGAIAERDENYWVQKTLAEMEAEADREWDSSVEAAGEGAPNFKRDYLGNVDRLHSDARGRAPSRRASRALELGLIRQRNARERRAHAFETEQKFADRKRTIVREADNIAQEAWREPGVEPYSPHGSLIPPGTIASEEIGANEFYTSRGIAPDRGVHEIPDWNSRYYSPRDFASGANMQDRTGPVVINKRLIAKLDWVTEQFGMGKLQINSGYRSPWANMRRASTGAAGPHTRGTAVDIQVRDLPQSEKNRLYSLFKAAGFNAFGFGNGAFHVEMRPGKGKGRGGDFEWTYGGAKKYSLVPVMQGDTRVAGQAWASVNQYPYIGMARLTARSETGRHNLVEASATIAPDSKGTTSYGIFGINSGGTMQGFVDANPDLGLTAKPGTAQFDSQWAAAVAKNPKRMIERQFKWHEIKVVRPAQRSLITYRLGQFSNDPRAVAFVADMVVQYGRGGVEKHLVAAAGATTVEQMIEVASQSMRDALDSDFASYLADNPENRRGLLNRIERRARDALGLAHGNGQPITGNVPRWTGPVPDINNIPGYADRLARIEAMVDTMGGTPEQRAQVRDRLVAQITRAWLSSLARTNPSAAMAALHSGKYDDALSIADEAALTNASDAGWKSYESEIRTSHKELLENLRAETSKLIADETASIAATGRGTGMLTDSHRAMMDDGDREALEMARFEYDTDRRIATARAEELPGILEDLEPEGEGFATEQKMYEYAATRVRERLELQANDPAGYVVTSNPRVGEMWAKAMQSNDPQEIQSAIRAMRAVQAQQGVAPGRIRSVTQSSATHNEGLLKAETADQAFANYLQLRDLYGGELGTILTEMERDGGVQGWSSVHEMVEAGNGVLGKSLARVVHAGAFNDGTRVGVRLARQGQTFVARTIFDGQMKRLDIKGIEPKGKSEDTDETADQIVQRVLGDALVNTPPLISAVRDAAMSHYVNNASLGEALDSERMAEAVQAVTGGILEHNTADNTGRFLAPIPGMTQTQFDTMLARIEAKDLKGAFIGYAQEPVTRGMLLGSLQLVSSGNGTYYLRWPGAGLVHAEGGALFELDLRAMAPELAKREAAAVRPRLPGGTRATIEQQLADIERAREDGILTVEEELELRRRHGALWGFRDGKPLVPQQ